MVSVTCFLLLIMVTAMNASRGTMTQIVFMDGRDNGPAMTILLSGRVGLRGQISRESPPWEGRVAVVLRRGRGRRTLCPL